MSAGEFRNSVEKQQQFRDALDPAPLLERARSEAGLTDFGDMSFLLPLEKAQELFSLDVPFHDDGLRYYQDVVVRDLVNRLRLVDDLKRHPEILDEDVSDPIIVIGLPRSGTTKTHRLLGADPALLKCRHWQLINPSRDPSAREGEPDPRIAAAISQDKLLEDNPSIRAAHYYAVDQVQEDIFLFGLTFNDAWYLTGRTPSRAFYDWLLTRDKPTDLENYKFVRTLFQYLQWQQGGRQGRRWVMKETGHIAHLDELLTVYPKATLVQIHRHPRNCLPSAAKLTSEVWKFYANDHDDHFKGRYWLERFKRNIDTYLADRDRLGLDGRILDISYEDVRSNALPVMRQIYERAGVPLSAESEQAILAWDASNEEGKHGAHSYSLEQYGLTGEEINATFADYIARFVSPR